MRSDSPSPDVVPTWYAEGAPCHDIYGRSVDAHYIFDDEVEVSGKIVSWGDLEWRECQVPVADFAITAISYEDFLKRLYEHDPDFERERKQYILDWIENENGIAQAIEKSPLLATITNGQMKLEDGHHRLAIAHFFHNLDSVTVLCGNLDRLPPKNTLRPR
jgi:hypothetical protein